MASHNKGGCESLRKQKPAVKPSKQKFSPCLSGQVCLDVESYNMLIWYYLYSICSFASVSAKRWRVANHHGSTWHCCCWFHANPPPIPLGLEISLAFHRLILIEHLFVRPLSLLHHLHIHTIYGIAVRMYTRVNASLSSLYSGLVHLSDSELFQIDVLGGFARLGVRLFHNNII